MEKYSLLILSWVVYFVLHSVLAADRVKSYFSQSLGKGYRYYRLLYVGLESDAQEQFKADGILKYVRHPIYSATVLIVIAFWLFIPNVTTLVSACCIFNYLAIGIPLEEWKLIKKYGEAYREYKDRVPSIMPKIKP